MDYRIGSYLKYSGRDETFKHAHCRGEEIVHASAAGLEQADEEKWNEECN